MSNPEQPARPAPTEVTSADQVSIRRAPKFGVFIVGGGLLGFLVTFVVVLATMGIEHAPSDGGATTSADTGFWGLVGYFSLYGVSAGLVLGAIVAVVLDRWYAKRARTLTAERIGVAMPTPTVDGEIDDER